jgi:hypothetical protein
MTTCSNISECSIDRTLFFYEMAEKNLIDKLRTFHLILNFPMERDFVADRYLKFASDYQWLAVLISGLYLLFCFVGIRIMRNYKPFDLRYLLALWNANLSLFSFIGMLRTVTYRKA